jgi:hypothetical protein
MQSRDSVAEALYTTYCEAVGGVAFNGDPLPAWKEFVADSKKQKQAQAWLSTADRAIQLLTP